MISKKQFADEFSDLAYQAGIEDTCALEFPEYMSERNERSPRSFAEVAPFELHFCFAPQVLELPWQHRRGLIMHELGHVLCRDLPGGGTERDADQAAERAFRERIIYDQSWPGKGLQCVRANPVKLRKIKLSPAQESALEARGLDYPEPEEQLLADAWKGSYLEFAPEHAEEIFDAITDAANAEGGMAEEIKRRDPQGAKYARAASRSLTALGGKVIKVLAEDWKRNPPFSGYDPKYAQRKLPPDPTKISYRTKRDALNVFIDWNLGIIDEAFSGPTAKQPPDSFDNFNRMFDLEGRRQVDTFAKALWLAMPPGSPYYLEDINVEMLNETSPMRHNTDRYLTIPDYAEESRLLAKEAEYWEERYGGIFPEEEEVPF
jgi:hypothetical protein